MKGVVVEKLKSFKDERGEFVELWHEGTFENIGFWVEDDITVNRKGILRGLHGDGHTWKLITCIKGRIFFVVASRAPKYAESMILSEVNRFQVLIPPDYAVGYLALEPSIVHYKQSNRYGSFTQFTLPWDDPGLGIKWPIKEPILSERDASA